MAGFRLGTGGTRICTPEGKKTPPYQSRTTIPRGSQEELWVGNRPFPPVYTLFRCQNTQWAHFTGREVK